MGDRGFYTIDFQRLSSLMMRLLVVRPGKRGRGAEGKLSVLIACENNDGKPGFIAMEAVESVNFDTTNRLKLSNSEEIVVKAWQKNKE